VTKRIAALFGNQIDVPNSENYDDKKGVKKWWDMQVKQTANAWNFAFAWIGEYLSVRPCQITMPRLNIFFVSDFIYQS
jgi:hypothetical protein